MTTLADFAELVRLERGLSVVTTLRADGSAASTVVNAGVLRHPGADRDVVAFVSRGNALKLAHLRRDPRVTVVVRAGPRWVAVEGDAELAGPDDPAPWLAPHQLPALVRDVFRSAGGTHDDWDAYDAVMAEERRAAVLVTPRRVYSNPA